MIKMKNSIENGIDISPSLIQIVKPTSFDNYIIYSYFMSQKIKVRVQARCDLVVYRRVNCPELESDPNLFVFACIGFTRRKIIQQWR